MNTLVAPLPVTELILVRLLACPKDGLSPSRIRRDLAPFCEETLTPSGLRQQLEAGVAQLLEAGVVQREGKSRLRPTDEGRRRARAFLGARELPDLTWPSLRNTYLLARAVGLPAPDAKARKRLASADGLRAALLRQEHDLKLDTFPTLTQVKHALAWRSLGVETGDRLTLGALLKHVLNGLLDSAQPLDVERVTRQLAAQVVQARRADPNQLRVAALQRLVAAPGVSPSPAPTQPEAPEPTPAPEPNAEPAGGDLERFAERVRSVAESCVAGRFGSNKVFIHYVWQAFAARWPIEKDAFTARLIEAHGRHLLDLSRADLVEAMDREDVLSSEIRDLNATYHFVRT